MTRSIYDSLWSRLAARLTPQIIDRLTALIVADLNGQIEKSFLPALDEKVKQLAVEHARAAVDEMFVSKMATSESFTRANLFLPNEIMAGSEATEYLRASNSLARDFFSPEFKIFCEKSLHERPLQYMHRKIWEFAFIYHRLRAAGVLGPGRRGLGFGVGIEKLPAIFASLGVHVTATDAPIDIGEWRKSGQYSGSSENLYYPDIIDRDSFTRLVRYEGCDMNNISSHLENYDFCWSSCAFEHLGSLQNGLDFFINSVEKTLKIGGVACHTTELNLSSDTDTLETSGCVLYRKSDLEQLSAALRERGHWVEPLRIEPGDLPPDYLVDTPPYSSNPHLKLLLASYVTTSVGLVARRGR